MDKVALLDQRSKDLRKVVVKTMIAGNRGHLPSAFSVIDILRVLYDDILRFDSSQPLMKDRDRCILSKGHGCLALYAILADKGFFPAEELDRFCKKGAMLGGHPEQGKIPGVEASTGSLGHGLPIGVGFALNGKYEKQTYNTFVVVGDGEINEGSVWEAAMMASKHRLDNLVVVVDYNKQQSYDSTSVVFELEPLIDKWNSFGFSTTEVDGHDIYRLKEVLLKVPLQEGKPTAIICHTIKGKGISFLEKNLDWHHKSNLKEDDKTALLKGVE
jgi:transketolase